MKVEKTLQPPQASSRKVSVWSREKINQLIELYKKNECLWNVWHESYKSKEKRNRAIEEICNALRISKFDFGKKIHNLRNQFNTEMKKLEQRIEEAGGSETGVDEDSTTAMRCKWSHFEALMFLRHVIEPRPGGYQNTFQAPKKMRLRFDYNSAEDDVNVTMLPANSNTTTTCNNEDITHYQYEEDNANDENATEDFQNFENDLTEVVGQAAVTREETLDQKYQPTFQQQQNLTSLNITNPLTTNTRSYVQTNAQQKTTQHPCQHPSHTAHPAEIINLNNDNSTIIDLNTNNLAVVSSNSATTLLPPSTPILSVTAPQTSASSTTASLSNTPVISSVNSTNSTSTTAPRERDQWDAFGELVASEFRNLNSDISRKRLKRKIMQAMLEVGEADDSL